MIKAWVFEFVGVSGPSPDFSDEALIQRSYDDNLERIASLEDLGFEGVFFSEHHFVHSLAPSPHLLIANVAARTKRLKLGVMGTVLALHQPWRVAEELGMLDYLTKGRLEIGVAAGVPPEFLFVNIPQDAIRPLYEDGIAFLEEAFKTNQVTLKGRHWEFDDLPITPEIKKSVSRRRKWMAVYTEKSCRAAAGRQWRVCAGFQSTANMAKIFNAYREEADKGGFEVGPEDMAIRRHILIGESEAQARELISEAMPLQQKQMSDAFAPVEERLRKVLGHGAADGVLKTGARDATGPAHAPAPGAGITADPVKAGVISLEDEFLFGSPKTVADKIIAQCREAGAGHIVGIHLGPLSPAQIQTNYRLWPQVIEILEKANIPRDPALATA